MKMIMLIMATALLIESGLAWATNEGKPEIADTVARNAGGKFGRGLVNIATGWGEMYKCPRDLFRERRYLLGLTWGTLQGISMTVIRTTTGVFETVLFFYPLPGNYDPMLEPEFIPPGTIFIRSTSAVPSK